MQVTRFRAREEQPRVTDSTGTVRTYDASEVLTSTAHPSSGPGKRIYLTDPQCRRTDTWCGVDASEMPGVAQFM